MPWEEALIFVVDTLNKYNPKKKLKLLLPPRFLQLLIFFKALCIGADVYNSTRGMMLAFGCIQSLKCNTNECPTGVATNNPKLMRGLVVFEKWKRFKNYHKNILENFLELLAASDCNSPEEMNRSLIFKKVSKKSISYAG